MALTTDQQNAISLLAASGLSIPDIEGAIMNTQAAAARAASLASIPPLPTIDPTTISEFQAWILDGRGTNDIIGEAKLVAAAMAAHDNPGIIQHTFQLLKDVMFFVAPEIGAAAVAAATAAKGAT